MKFPVDKCPECGLDLTTAEPAEVTNYAEMAIGTCPSCGRSYIMVEVTPPPEPPKPVVEPDLPVEEAPSEEPGSEE